MKTGKKIIAVVVVAAVTLLLFASCTGKDGNNSDSLVIYSPYGADERGEFIKKAAKEELGLNVEFVSGGGGGLKDRLILEKKNPQADVIIGLYQLFMYELKNEDVLQSYAPKWINEVDNSYRDSDDAFSGFGKTPIVMAYNKDHLSEDEIPESWLTLCEKDYTGKFSVGSIENQTTRVLLSCLLWRFYDEAAGQVSSEGWESIKNFYNNAAVTKNDQFSWSDVKNGTVPIVTDWYGGAKNGAETNEIPLIFCDFSDGTPIVSENIGLIKNCKNSENAKKFIDWFGSNEFMAKFANEFYYKGQLPLSQNAINSCIDEVKTMANYFTPQNINWEEMSKHSTEWISKIQMEYLK